MEPETTDPTRLQPAVVAIVTRDRPGALARNLGAGLDGLRRAGVDVVVVDQSDGPQTEAVIGRMEGVRYLRSERGLSIGRNAAVSGSVAPIVAFTDDDVIFPDGWIAEMLAAFDRHPEAGAVCGRAVTSAGTLLPGTDAGSYRWPTSPFRLGSGFNFAFRRSALDQVGGFDPSLGAGGRFRSGEDTDMLYRVMRAGWTVVCSDAIRVVHDERRTGFEQVRVHHGYGIGAGAQTAKHRIAGDRTAVRIGCRELAHHGWYLLRSIPLLRVRIAAFQIAYAVGFMRGAAAAALFFRRIPPYSDRGPREEP